MHYEVHDPARGWTRVQPEVYKLMTKQGRETRVRSPKQNVPWRLIHTPKEHNRNHWEVWQGSAHLGSFWMCGGTVYAWTVNQPGESDIERLLGHDIGWMDTAKAAQHVHETYHKNRVAAG